MKSFFNYCDHHLLQIFQKKKEAKLGTSSCLYMPKDNWARVRNITRNFALARTRPFQTYFEQFQSILQKNIIGNLSSWIFWSGFFSLSRFETKLGPVIGKKKKKKLALGQKWRYWGRKTSAILVVFSVKKKYNFFKMPPSFC